MDPIEHKKSLMKLKQTDPEFYTYLKENDKNLLEFNVSDDDDRSSISESDTRHIPSAQLEVASDESDYEAEEDSGARKDKGKVTLKLLKTWQEEIQKDKTLKTIKCAVEAFHAALRTVSESTEAESLSYKVEGSAVFNGVVQLCILYLPDAFKRYLKLDSTTQTEVHKSKGFSKVKGILRSYLTDLIKILQNVTSTNILTVLLKHLHQMLPYTQSFSSMTKPLLKILLTVWSSGEETVRVVSFLCILRIATTNREAVLDTLFKTMYVKYVENAKFVSLTALPGINFMRHSLAEIYLLDHNLAYNHAFLYIRQLAIHLRNAMTLKKKENFQVVYNWQYINSLHFWSELIKLSKQDSMLRSLLYPLVQIIIGTIKLIPTPQYYPLRFHCLQMLTDISKETDTFIPVLPFLLEILNSYDFNKKHKAVSMKPVPFICILRASKSQLQENGFKDNVIDSGIIQLKAFLKKCHIANKTVVDLKNMSEIKKKNEAIAEYTLPTIRKPKKGKPIEESEHESEEESDFELRLKSGDSGEQKSEPPAKPKKKKLKKAGKKVEDIELPRDNTDIVQDMNTDDWD